jgi:glycosyltransferase involved in cell wall biosynthesis
MKRILFVSGSTNLGGAEIQLFELFRNFENTIDAKIVLIGKRNNFCEYLEINNANYVAFDFRWKSAIFDVVNLVKLTKKFKPEVLIGWLYKGDLIGSIVGKFCGVNRIIGSARNTAWPRQNALKLFAIRITHRFLCDAVVANSEISAKWHKENNINAKKVYVIENFIREMSIRKFKLQNHPKKKIVLGLASRPVIGKGHLLVLEAAQILRQDGFNVHVDFIGFGIPKWGYLKTYLQENRCSEFTQLKEGVFDLSEWYAEIDLYVLASDAWESDSNSLLEAILCEVPVIVSSVLPNQNYNPAPIFFEKSDVFSLVAGVKRHLLLNFQEVQSQTQNRRNNLIHSRNQVSIINKWKTALNEK